MQIFIQILYGIGVCLLQKFASMNLILQCSTVNTKTRINMIPSFAMKLINKINEIIDQWKVLKCYKPQIYE
jgi:hypothetical protein